jgi:hypothetical protein
VVKDPSVLQVAYIKPKFRNRDFQTAAGKYCVLPMSIDSVSFGTVHLVSHKVAKRLVKHPNRAVHVSVEHQSKVVDEAAKDMGVNAPAQKCTKSIIR